LLQLIVGSFSDGEPSPPVDGLTGKVDPTLEANANSGLQPHYPQAQREPAEHPKDAARSATPSSEGHQGAVEDFAAHGFHSVVPLNEAGWYAAAPEYNRRQISLDEEQLSTLGALLDKYRAEISDAQERRDQALAEWVEHRIASGNYIALEKGEKVVGKDGEITMQRATRDGQRMLIRIAPNEYAPLDVAYSDMITSRSAATENIMRFFSGL